MRELSKSIPRRQRDPGFTTRFFVGDGVDIGGAPDPLSLYQELFPLLKSVRVWDLEDGDAQLMSGVPDNSFDLVHSSHCLEHLHNPRVGLQNWLRICAPGGHIVITVPDEDIYEQGIFPSTYNHDHKWTFTSHKNKSWSEKSINLMSLVEDLGDSCQLISLRLEDSAYRYRLPRFDQTSTPVAESCWELVLRKRTSQELEELGLRTFKNSNTTHLNQYFNQYKLDYQTLKAANKVSKPFSNFEDLT
jgi:SAM-dependent methyltransferase